MTSKTTKKPAIVRVAVLGLGTMGHSIAQTLASSGCRVGCYDTSAEALETLTDRVRTNLEQMSQAGLFYRDELAPTLHRLKICPDLESAVSGAQLIVEAVREDLETKKSLFGHLENLVSKTTILTSNTSTFPMTEISKDLQDPDRTIVTHWFNPPHIVPLVEVVPGKRTCEETTRTTMNFLEEIGKIPIRLKKEIPGFLVNRIQAAVCREVWDLLDRGIANADEIDLAIRTSMGFRLAAAGPLEIMDFAGLDITGQVFGQLVQEICSEQHLPAGMKKLIEQNYLGVKTCRGIYDYTPEQIKKLRARRDRLFLQLSKLLYGKS